MLRVVLADDENKVILLMQKLIDWEKLGYEIVGTANDGLRALELERWIERATRIVDRHRFDSRELTVRDFILALDRDVDHHLRWAAARLRSPETAEMLERMELQLPPERRLTELSMLDYYRLCVFRVWFWQGSCSFWTALRRYCAAGMWKS